MRIHEVVSGTVLRIPESGHSNNSWQLELAKLLAPQQVYKNDTPAAAQKRGNLNNPNLIAKENMNKNHGPPLCIL